MEVNKIYNCDCIEGLKLLENDSVDLTVTSPPYDDLRTYGKTLEWNFDVFKPIAKELYRVTKPGGIVVWVVGDATINGSETLTSFKQAEYFVEICGFKLHDTMIYEKNGSSRPAQKTSKRYSQIFEYMFVFVKDEIRKDITLIADKRNKWAGWAKWGKNSSFDVDGNLVERDKNQPVISEFSLRNNIWKYSVSFNDKTGHPAVFPELLAQDHILSWSKEGDLVLDPFMGSGTTAKMAILNKRNYIGFEKNTEYYEKSLERVAKYEGQVNNSVETMFLEDYDDELQYGTEEDKELKGKTLLWEKYIEQLNQYFNEQTLGTLKSLRFNFVTKTNDERVKKITGDNSQPSQVPSDGEPVQLTKLDIDNSTCLPLELPNNGSEIKLNEEHIKELAIQAIKENEDFLNEYLKEYIAKYYRIPRLTDAIVEANERAKKEKEQKEEPKKYPIQMVQLREQDFVEKPKKRHRRTKAEMEEARKAEALKKNGFVINDVHTDDDGTVHVNAQVINAIDHIETTFEVGKETTAQAVNDELPFVFDNEEERQRIVGNPLGDIVDGKPVYIEQPPVEVKKHRGRPRKNPVK